MKLTFLGATGTVTGSKYLLEDDNKKILIDCGLFQGMKELRQRNWENLPVNPASINAVILTHAHIDHSGYLPLLVKNGFDGQIYCSSATADLCDILLPDSAHLHEEDAERANRYGYTRHKPALPLYTQEDSYNALEKIEPVSFGDEHALSDILSFRLTHAGHILGASCVHISDGQTNIVFSGDLGRPRDPVMKVPAQIQEADYLILESTYGDRLHETTDPLDQLEDIIIRTSGRGGTVVIPAFAVGRAQSLMYYIYKLKEMKRIPGIPVYLDSPMAISATKLLQQHHAEHRLSKEECAKVCNSVIYTQTVEQSKAIYSKNNGMPTVIISASGMATGGRVLHHLKHYISDPRNTVLLAGFQAEGTRGARLAHGEVEIKIHGELLRVRAEIDMLDNISAHADYQEIIDWLGHFREPPRRTFLTHGEPKAATSFKFKIKEHLDWNVEIPEYEQMAEL
ncbi:MAG TPA: MBL fold metallo-hydrolase [Alphaproteobacteria bacterium]|nr:MAG: MBL fold metallo-hydrolase [Rhodospirillales bacterium]HOO82136.1 MBL fold metallo-hydrolase [Alphaproteobacteria bacterium]